MVFVNPRLAAHLDIQTVSGTGSMGEEILSAAQKRRLKKELIRIEPFRQVNRLLEVGAGRGWFLREAAEMGWETLAIEINSDALSYLADKQVGRIISEPAERFEIDAPVDVVRMWDVIEHLTSPRKAMENIHRALRPGGLLRLATTNFASLSRWINGPEWVYLNGSDHIFLFEPATIARLLQEGGFSNITIRTRDFNMKRKLYHPERDLPARWVILKPFSKLLDETMCLTDYGHQLIVTAVRVA
jgi:2-polyprenyl-3-methyl-5-hydroxy-6-metoxy-1,4-benzoquinol methylase